MPLNANFPLTKLVVSDCARMAGGAAPAVFDDLILHIAPDKFYLESLSSTQSVLVIDRISYEISLQVAQNIKRIFLREGQEKQSTQTFQFSNYTLLFWIFLGLLCEITKLILLISIARRSQCLKLMLGW